MIGPVEQSKLLWRKHALEQGILRDHRRNESGPARIAQSCVEQLSVGRLQRNTVEESVWRIEYLHRKIGIAADDLHLAVRE